jgi:hypothetical protein
VNNTLFTLPLNLLKQAFKNGIIRLKYGRQKLTKAMERESSNYVGRHCFCSIASGIKDRIAFADSQGPDN